MNNIILFILIPLLFCEISFGQSYIDIKWKNDIKEKKKVIVKDVLNSLYIYDNRGNNIEHLRYNENDTSPQRFIYVYDEKDKLTESYYYGVYTGWATKIEYIYNKSGNKVRETEFDARLKMSQIKSRVYDKKGNLEKAFTIDWRGDTVATIKYENDEKGRIIKATHFINTKIFNLLYEYKYDFRNNIIENNVYDNVGFLWRDVFEFDERGNKIREFTESKKGGRKVNEKFIYDEHNNMISRIYFEGNDTNKTENSDNYKFIYEENGNKLEEYFITDKGDIILDKSFEYDRNGNMIKEIHYHSVNDIDREWYCRYDSKGNLLEECEAYYKDIWDDANDKAEFIREPENDYCTKYEYEFYE
ncbi:MAG: hypothetical protein NTU73_00220 [Ignavibacteriae bacterium]|nr:hypothetical protein [Ignavibacteriota bacterium]